jgi:hypothetical protein
MWQPSSAQSQQTTSSAEGGGGASMGFQTIGDARSFLKLPPYMSISRTRHRSGGRWATIDDEVDHHSPRLLEPRSPRGQLAASQPPFEVKSVAAPTDVILTRRVRSTPHHPISLKVAPDVGHGFGGKNCDVCLPFVVEKVVGRGTRKKPLVIEVDFPGRTLRYRYPDGRKPTFQRPHHTLLQVWTTLPSLARVSCCISSCVSCECELTRGVCVCVCGCRSCDRT